MAHLAETWRNYLTDCTKMAAAANPYQLAGRLTRINGLVM